MISPVQLFLNRANRKIVMEIQRQISKTASTPNSDTISRKDNKFAMAMNLNSKEGHVNNKWSKINKQNSIRALSTIQNKTKPAIASNAVFSKEISREFMAIFPDIVRDLTDAGRHTDIPEVTKRFAKVLQYNIPNGKKNRGLSAVIAYKILEKPENLTPENVRLSNILGWCVELIQSYFLICDDIVDQSETRRGQPCWYRQNNVGLQAINDAMLVENSVYFILQKYLSDRACYVPIVELFHDITTKTAMGQSLDALCITPDGKPLLDQFTMNRYNAIIKYKTAYYTYHLPVAAAMYLANMYDPEQHRQAKTILIEIGSFFQVQDDFIDCFGNPEVTGKIGTDIKDGKCTWLAVVALQRANPAQRTIMEDHYGKPEDSSIQAIRNLYEELGLRSTYAVYEEESYNIIQTHIHQISKGLPHEVFLSLMNKIFKRNR